MSHPFHPVSELFPLMTGSPFDELVADIKANGLREPIWRHDGQIIDGRNRYNACEQIGVEPTYREWDGNGDLTKFVVSLNLHRRHLNESQRAMVAAKIATRTHGQRRNEFAEFGELPPSDSAAAEMLNVGCTSVKEAKRVRREGTDEVVAAVERGDVSVNMAHQIVQLPKEQQADELKRRQESKGKRDVRQRHANSNGNGITTNTKRHPGRKAPAAIRGAIGTLVGLATGLDSFTVKDAAPSADEAEQWERDLAVVISAINRFRRQLKEHVHV